jgi:glycosyltransferase involved in cell wall biosynthesis
MLSLITSLYKTERYLPDYLTRTEKIAFELQAAGLPFEIVVVANDSSSIERDLLIKAGKVRPWLRVNFVQREPISVSWNRGLNLASGQVLGFWNVDDTRFSKAIIDGYSLVVGGFPMVYFPYIYKRYVKFLGISWLAKQKTVHPPEFEKKEFSRSMHAGPFYLFSRKFYTLVGPYDEQFRIAQDFDWCARASAKGTFVLCKKIAGIFINEGVSLSGSKNPRHQVEDNVVSMRYGDGDKIKAASEEIMLEYDIKSILYKGKKIPL